MSDNEGSDATKGLLSLSEDSGAMHSTDSDSDSDESSDDNVPLLLYAFQYSTRVEARLTQKLEQAFTVSMQDLQTQPIGLYALGICAGGLFGVYPAAFSVGYVSTALCSYRYRMLCDMLLMCIGIHEMILETAPSIFPTFCLGKELQKFMRSRRLTPQTAAAMSIYSIGILSPTLGTTMIIVMKSFYDALTTVRGWHT